MKVTSRKTDAVFNFTESEIRKLESPTSGRVYHYDAAKPGLALCVTAKGQKTFYVIKRVKKRRKSIRYKLGKWPDLKLEDARKDAGVAITRIEHDEDIQAQRILDRKTDSEEWSLKKLFEEFIADAKSRKRRSWPQSQYLYDHYLGNSKLKPEDRAKGCVDWSQSLLSTIKSGDVDSLHGRIGNGAGHYSANRVLSLLSCMFKFAIKKQKYSPPNPARDVEKFPEAARKRYLSSDEKRAFWTALEDETPMHKDYFRILALTGARRMNVASMRWAELDLDGSSWTIPGSKFKNGEAHTVALNGPAVKILKARERQRLAGNEFVFPSHGKAGHLASPQKRFEAVCARAGLEDFRIHDLRHTYASQMIADGATLEYVGKQLGHLSHQSSWRYAHLNINSVRPVNDKAGESFMKAATAKKRKG